MFLDNHDTLATAAVTVSIDFIYLLNKTCINLAVVAWSVRASGNNTVPWQAVD